ncbi:hypothetical protein H5410_011729 [Solanum commersonii]|uniref:30S ribosomal protein S8, chloroplastic n=1 Tax=Solanum commersonii TaxID=4109 RepID=A0A9J6AQX4_SOLCO|nr:hypothetical protein H5410_011729 [Solanum commersonii]
MGRDTIAEIITSIRNADMDRKRVVRIASTNITENIVQILLREGFIENILPGDRVKIEVSPYDSTKGHIIYRLHNKDLKD